MPKTADEDAILERLYDAATGAEPWRLALGKLTEAVGASSGILFTPELPPADGLFLTHQIDPTAIEAYGTYYRERDLWFQAAERGGYHRRGTIVTGAEIIGKEEFEGSEWYNDFCRPLDIYHLGAAIVSDSTHSSLPRIHLSLFRASAADNFDAIDRRLLSRLGPHLERALTIHAQLDGRSAAIGEITDVLDVLRVAVLVVNSARRITFLNAAARGLLAQGDGLSSRNGVLRADAVEDNRQLEVAVGAAALNPVRSQACSIRRRSGLRNYQVVAFALPRHARGLGSFAAKVALFVFDPESGSELPQARLMRLLGLTPAEARLVAALAGGATLGDYADSAGITLGTARWTLKQALAKTGTDRQSSLIVLAMKAAILRGDRDEG